MSFLLCSALTLDAAPPPKTSTLLQVGTLVSAWSQRLHNPLRHSTLILGDHLAHFSSHLQGMLQETFGIHPSSA